MCNSRRGNAAAIRKNFLIGTPLTLVAFLVAALWAVPAEARAVSPWGPDRIAKAAQQLVVGEVLEVAQTGVLEEGNARWKHALISMNAKVLAYRSFSVSGCRPIRNGETVDIPYLALDPRQPVLSGPMFPQLSRGDLYVFPLRESSQEEGPAWELVNDEDVGLLIPAVPEQLGQGGGSLTGTEFLLAELAGSLTSREYKGVSRAANYLRHLRAAGQLDRVYELVERNVADDEDRWLAIGVASYCAMGTPRPSIAQLLEAVEQKRPQASLAARALRRVPRAGIDDRIIAESMKQARVNAWGTAVMIADNYSQNPTAMRLLRESLDAGLAEAVYVAALLIRDEDHPLVEAAVRAAERLLLADCKPDYNNLRAACALIRDQGDEETFALLLDEIKTARNTDRERYGRLWSACAGANNQRLIQICRIVIDDTAGFSWKSRFCDAAAFELQRVTGRDFGLASEQSDADREAAIRRARAYFDE